MSDYLLYCPGHYFLKVVTFVEGLKRLKDVALLESLLERGIHTRSADNLFRFFNAMRAAQRGMYSREPRKSTLV